MARRIIGLDLGAYSVKLLRLETGNQEPKFEVQDVVEEPLPFDETGEKDLIELQKEAVMNLYRRGLLEGESYAVGLCGSAGQMRSMKVPFDDTHKINAVLPGLLEAEVPFELDGMIFTWFRPGKHDAVDGGDKEGDDGSMIRLAFGRKSEISKSLQMLQQFAVDPRLMHLNSVGHYELVRELGGSDFFSGSLADITSRETKRLGAIVDLGHCSTNICIFDEDGLISAKTFLSGGKKLTEDIASALDVTFKEAEHIKHNLVNFQEDAKEEKDKKVNELARKHYDSLSEQISRMIISLNTNSEGHVASVAFVGGGAKTVGLDKFFNERLDKLQTKIVSFDSVLPENVRDSSMSLAFALSLSCMHPHAKESRFNFRIGEFAWRGELDFLRAKSMPLVLWLLVVICSLTVLWSAKSMVLEKENSTIEAKLDRACTQILAKKNINPKKCLSLMKEQITSNVEVGVPEYTASDVYLNLAKFLDKDLKIEISELDISEKRVRMLAETTSFEDVDKVIAGLNKIPCFVKVERGRATQADKVVKFNPSAEIDCVARAEQEKSLGRGL